MRTLLRNRLARLVAAALPAAAVAWAGWRHGPDALAAAVFVGLTGLCFAALTVAPDAIAYRRGHRWRWWWRSSDDEGPFWPGTRVPRHPRG